jgi:hypothetical protein
VATSFTFPSTFGFGDVVSGDLSQVAALQNLSAGTTVVFREPIWYGSTSPAPTESWFIYDFASGDDLSLYGTVAASGGTLVGDINQDHIVDARDVGPMLAALANVSSYSAMLDLNHDANVSSADLQWLLNHLKTGNGTLDAVPEPSSFVLIAVGAVAAFGIRRRCRAQR